MPTTTLSTTLLESVNIVLANLGESPVNSLSGGALPQQVSLALNTIEEVSTDIQSKGWWFNQKTGSNYDTTANVVIYPSNTTNEWGLDIPEEARRYITIRASRIAQTRLIGSEELQKFSYNEELVSLAVLQQAHVRNSNGVLDFNSFPAELRGLGMDEVMFLQGNVEEKIGTLRLGGELANTAKTKAETALLADQEELVTKQALTEVKKALDVVADTDLKALQGGLLSKQTLTEVQNALKVIAEAALIADQENLVEQQVLTEVQETTKRTREAELIDAQEALLQKQILTEAEQVAKVQEEVDLLQTQDTLVAAQATDVAADTTLKGLQGTLLGAQTTDVGADTVLKGKQGALVDAQELKTDAETTLTSNQSSLVASQKTQLDAQTAIEATAEKAFYDGVVAGTQDTYRDYAAEMRIMGVQESLFQQTPAYKKIEMLKDAAKLRLSTATEVATAAELIEVNKIMRFIGEPPVTAANSNSLTSETVRLLRDTSEELQGRGWWFNTEKDVELPEVTEFVVSGDGGQWDGIYVYNATNGRYERTNGNNVHYFSKTDTNDTNTVGTWVLASEHPAGVYDATFDANVGTGAYPDPALFEVGTLVVEHRIAIPADVLSVEANDYDTLIKTVGGVRYLYDLKKKSYEHWLPAPVKATVIYNRGLLDLPQKFLEYLNVRVAILLTELYPQSGVDIQRLPKMEAELRAYFKDREFDDANYSIFDSYDVASRIGINRNYDLT